MTDSQIIYFIWTKGLRGPSPEIIYGLEQNKDSNNKDRKEILQQHKLMTEYRDLNINQLVLIYPYKGKENETKEAKN